MLVFRRVHVVAQQIGRVPELVLESQAGVLVGFFGALAGLFLGRLWCFRIGAGEQVALTRGGLGVVGGPGVIGGLGVAGGLWRCFGRLGWMAEGQDAIDDDLLGPPGVVQAEGFAHVFEFVAFELAEQVGEVDTPGPNQRIDVAVDGSSVGDVEFVVLGQVGESVAGEHVQGASPFGSSQSLRHECADDASRGAGLPSDNHCLAVRVYAGIQCGVQADDLRWLSGGTVCCVVFQKPDSVRCVTCPEGSVLFLHPWFDHAIDVRFQAKSRDVSERGEDRPQALLAGHEQASRADVSRACGQGRVLRNRHQ